MPLSMRRLKPMQSHADLRPLPSRKDISLPINLISTTNVLSYEAPDLPVARQMMATRSSSDSNSVTGPPTDLPSLTPDSASPGSSPAVEYNHLSAYFPGPTGKQSISARQTIAADMDAPVIPKRVPSHSKREHERLARKRSLRSSGKSSPVDAPSSPTTASGEDEAPRTSFEMMGVNGPEPPPKTNPSVRSRSTTVTVFNPELERLNEVAETDGIDDEDTIYMRKRGLVKATAADYRNDIGLCYPKGPFGVGFTPVDNSGGWI